MGLKLPIEHIANTDQTWQMHGLRSVLAGHKNNSVVMHWLKNLFPENNNRYLDQISVMQWESNGKPATMTIWQAGEGC